MTVERRNVPHLAPPPAYAHVAVAAGLVFTAGAVPLDADGALVGPGDPVAQTRRTIDNLVAALAEAGATPDDLVKTTVYVVADVPEPLRDVWAVVRESPLAGAPSTLVGVAVLGYGGQLVEIEAVAVAPAVR